MFNKVTPTKTQVQYSEFEQNCKVGNAKLEWFDLQDKVDCYNSSMPFEIDGKQYILCRTQPRNGLYSKTRFFQKKSDGWYVVPDSYVFDLEDPSVAYIDGKLVVAGVNVSFNDGVAEWKTDFYICNSPYEAQYLTSGPLHMKDIRLVQLQDGKVGVITRPLGKEINDGHLARIGFTKIDSIYDLNENVIASAPKLNDFFLPDEWGGSNAAYLLSNGLVGIIAHKSYRSYDREGEKLHYYGAAFALDPDTLKTSDMKIIVGRKCFPYYEPREPKLADVTFMAGIIRHQGGTATVYTGLSDSAVGSATIPDPFLEYEKIKTI